MSPQILTPIRLVAGCRVGGEISAAIKEAVVLAFERDLIVEFTHNERVYVVHPQAIINRIYELADPPHPPSA